MGLSTLNTALLVLPPQGSTLHGTFGPPESQDPVGSASEVSLSTTF